MTSRPKPNPARRCREPWGPVAERRYAGSRAASFTDLFYNCSTLLAHELRDIVWPAPAFARGSRALPTAERLRAGPRARRRTRPLVRVAHARLDFIEESLDLGGRA